MRKTPSGRCRNSSPTASTPCTVNITTLLLSTQNLSSNVKEFLIFPCFLQIKDFMCKKTTPLPQTIYGIICSHFPGFFIPGFPKLQRFQAHHELILSKMLPKLKKHLVSMSRGAAVGSFFFITVLIYDTRVCSVWGVRFIIERRR